MEICNVLVYGGFGQLGQCFQDIEKKDGNKGLNFIFLSSNDGDILDIKKIEHLFSKYLPTYVINCAAYTNVDNAEDHIDSSSAINVIGVANLVKYCDIFKSILIHISTDFVFDGTQSFPLRENDATNPLGVYGQTKLDGEKEITNLMSHYFIIRTSWLYSEFGNNFLKTIQRLSKERNQLSVVCDQIGTPTYGVDLAKFIIYLILNKKTDYGIYHFSNEGVASWYDFAYEILKNTCFDVLPINTEEFPTKAIRPKYSVLDKKKLKDTFSYSIPYWKESLNQCLNNLNQNNNNVLANAGI